MPGVFLSIVIPAFNEEKNIAKVIRDHVSLLTRGHPAVRAWEIVCLDDASTDETAQILCAVAQDIAGVRLIRHQRNSGIAASFAVAKVKQKRAAKSEKQQTPKLFQYLSVIPQVSSFYQS